MKKVYKHIIFEEGIDRWFCYPKDRSQCLGYVEYFKHHKRHFFYSHTILDIRTLKEIISFMQQLDKLIKER